MCKDCKLLQALINVLVEKGLVDQLDIESELLELGDA